MSSGQLCEQPLATCFDDLTLCENRDDAAQPAFGDRARWNFQFDEHAHPAVGWILRWIALEICVDGRPAIEGRVA